MFAFDYTAETGGTVTLVIAEEGVLQCIERVQFIGVDSRLPIEIDIISAFRLELS